MVGLDWSLFDVLVVVPLIIFVLFETINLRARVARIESVITQLIDAVSSNFMKEANRITTEGEQILPFDLKEEIKELVKSKEIKKHIKKDKSAENITPFITERISGERFEEVAKAVEIEAPTASLIGGLYAIKCWEEGEINEKKNHERRLEIFKKKRRNAIKELKQRMEQKKNSLGAKTIL